MRASSRFVATTALCAVLALAVGACGRSEPTAQKADTTKAATSSTSSTTAPTTIGPTVTGATLPTGACDAQSGGDAQGGWFLTALRQARNEVDGRAVDRVVWEFRPRPGTTVGAAPAYTVEPVDPPYREDPSDLVLDVAGTTGLRVRFANATAVDLTQLEPERTYTGETDVVTGRDPLAAVVDGGDFEGQSIWFLGLTRPACPTVSTLADPVRVVVDVPAG